MLEFITVEKMLIKVIKKHAIILMRLPELKITTLYSTGRNMAEAIKI